MSSECGREVLLGVLTMADIVGVASEADCQMRLISAQDTKHSCRAE